MEQKQVKTAPIPPKTKRKWRYRTKYEVKLSREQLEVLDILTEDKGCTQIWTGKEETPFRMIKYCQSRDFINKITGLNINKKFNYYVTKNSFYQDKRGTEYLCSLYNIVVDLDNHKTRSYKEIDWNVDKLLYLMANDYSSYIPVPTMIVRTGRGVQLWYNMIESTAPQLEFIFRFMATALCDRFKKVITENEIKLEVDYTNSVNSAALVRLPNTFTTSRKGFKTSFEYIGCRYENIDQLITEYELRNDFPKPEPKPQQLTFSEVEEDKSQYVPLHKKRINFIEKLVEHCNGDMTGRRNTVLFFYYNALRQVYDRDTAVKKVGELNSKFVKRYSAAELRTVIKAVDKKAYKLKTDTFLDWLSLTAEERLLYLGTGSRKPPVDKTARDNRISQLATENKTCEQIADEVGCSVRTVKSVLKSKGFNKKTFLAIEVKELRKSMSVKQTAEKLGISVDTVKRLQKS